MARSYAEKINTHCWMQKKPGHRSKRWPGLAKSSGEEGKLSCAGRRRVLWPAQRLAAAGVASACVRHQANIHAAVLGAAFASLVDSTRLVLAQSDHINLVSGHVVLGGQILNHGIGAAFAEIIVVVGIPTESVPPSSAMM